MKFGDRVRIAEVYDRIDPDSDSTQIILLSIQFCIPPPILIQFEPLLQVLHNLQNFVISGSEFQIRRIVAPDRLVEIDSNFFQ